MDYERVEETPVKIYTLPVHPEFQPDHQNFTSSPLQQYGVEQDFLWWLQAHPELQASEPAEADWDYLPLFFNRIYVNAWGKDTYAVQAEILRLVSRNRPTFTIAEYDLHTFHPDLDLCSMAVFTASRRGELGIDIPLLCSPHPIPSPLPDKRWLASFVGNLNTFTPRPEMAEALAGRGDVWLEHASKGIDYFAQVMLQSYIGLAPRGYGGASFRFYEAMQLGVVPLLIGDLDTRPFKRWLPWDAVSLYLPDCAKLNELLDSVDAQDLALMGVQAQRMYQDALAFGKWPEYVLKELERL